MNSPARSRRSRPGVRGRAERGDRVVACRAGRGRPSLQPGRDQAARLRLVEHREGADRGGRVQGAAGRAATGQLHVAGGPVGEGAGQFVAALVVFLGCRQAAGGVRGADDPVGRGGGDPGEQPGPPSGEDVAPGLLRQLAAEVDLPVGHAVELAERVAPGRVGDPVAGPWGVVEAHEVAVEPVLHGVGAAEPDERLGGHRAVIGQAASELRAGRRQPAQALVEDAR